MFKNCGKFPSHVFYKMKRVLLKWLFFLKNVWYILTIPYSIHTHTHYRGMDSWYECKIYHFTRLSKFETYFQFILFPWHFVVFNFSWRLCDARILQIYAIKKNTFYQNFCHWERVFHIFNYYTASWLLSNIIWVDEKVKKM